MHNLTQLDVSYNWIKKEGDVAFPQFGRVTLPSASAKFGKEKHVETQHLPELGMRTCRKFARRLPNMYISYVPKHTLKQIYCYIANDGKKKFWGSYYSFFVLNKLVLRKPIASTTGYPLLWITGIQPPMYIIL